MRLGNRCALKANRCVQTKGMMPKADPSDSFITRPSLPPVLAEEVTFAVVSICMRVCLHFAS